MPHVAYVNGRYLCPRDATVGVRDRGFQFADSIYDVALISNGCLFAWDRHCARIRSNLATLAIPAPMSAAAFDLVVQRLIDRNGFQDGLLYIQMTRGCPRTRAHAFPLLPVKPTLVMSVTPFDIDRQHGLQKQGIHIVSQPDRRWGRCDLKTTGLLPNVLARQYAVDHGAVECWQVDGNGMVTEGAACNAWIVTPDGTIVTSPLSPAILPGITRAVLLDLIGKVGLPVQERPFSLREARAAGEAFITGTTSFCRPVVRIDDAVIGSGDPGPITTKLAALFWEKLAYETGRARDPIDEV